MRRVGRFLWLVTALLSLAVGVRADEADTNVIAEGSAPEIHFDRMTFDNVSKMSVGEGNVVIQDKEATLRADRVRYNKGTSEFWAEGNVRINQSAQEWVAPSGYYNFATHTLKTADARGFIDPLYLHVHDLVQVATNHYEFTHGSVTTCDLERSDYHLEAVSGEIWTHDRVLLHNATLHLGNTPVFWFPIVIWSLKGDMPPVAVTVGDNTRWGFFLLSSFTWKVSKDVDVTMHADERSDRGFGSGADVQYRFGSAAEGLLTGYYLNDEDPNRAGPSAGHRPQSLPGRMATQAVSDQ